MLLLRSSLSRSLSTQSRSSSSCKNVNSSSLNHHHKKSIEPVSTSFANSSLKDIRFYSQGSSNHSRKESAQENWSQRASWVSGGERNGYGWIAGILCGVLAAAGVVASAKEKEDHSGHSVHPLLNGFPDDNLPVEYGQATAAPNCPPPIKRDYPARVVVNLRTTVKELPVDTLGNTYEFWTFNDTVPGPMMRARVGDVLELHLKNDDPTGMQHNIDLHCVSGPGGGAALTTADKGETKRACFKLLYPGLYIYHCAVYPVPMHVANGMYGLILVEPEGGLPPVDKEFYVVQSEVYASPEEEKPVIEKKNNLTKFFSHHWEPTPEINPATKPGKKVPLAFNYEDLMNEKPRYVVLNGREGALTDNPLLATTKDKVRLYFGNAGPNLMSSFHVIGTVFDKVYREGDLMSPPGAGIHVTQVPSGGSAVVDFLVPVPGTYTILDHALSRMEKGCVGFIEVSGEQVPGIYHSDEPPKQCASCKIHP